MLVFGIAVFALCLFVLSGTPAFAESGDGPKVSPLPFDFDSFKRDLALWHFIVFMIVFGILAKFAFGPISKALDAREQSVADNISSAAKAHEDAQTLLAQYQAKLDAAAEEVRQIIAIGKKDAEVAGQAIIEKARQAAEMEHTRAVREIEAATTRSLQELAERSATLATQLAGKIMRDRIDPNAHQALIESAIKQFTTSNN